MRIVRKIFMKFKNIFLFARYFLIIAVLYLLVSPALTYADNQGGNSQGQPLGTVVNQQTATLPTDLQSIGTGKRVAYVSSDVNNESVVASALIITPNVRPSHPNIISWSHALSGIADQCAPSQNLTYFYPEAVAAVKSYLQQGWTVVATDYAGLGTQGTYQAFVGKTEAHSVIDSVRAARNLDSSLTNEWVASGHSGGGSSPLFAGEIAGTYGNGLDLRGVVSMAPLSNVDLVAPSLIGTPFQGELVVGLVGLAAADSNVDLDNILAQPAKNNLPVVKSTGCVFDILNAYGNFTPSQLLIGGNLSSSVINKLAHYDNPGQNLSSAPILLLQGADDQEIPSDLTQLLQSEICAQGSTSDLQILSGVGHDDLPVVTTGLVADYINARFNNQPAPNNCQ